MIPNINDVIMVDIDSNVVPCTVLELDYSDPKGIAVKLCDHGSGRHFWRALSAIENQKNFNGTITTYINYPDHLKSNRPDVVVKFSTKPPPKPRQKKEEKVHFTKSELETLRQILLRNGLDPAKLDED